MGVLDDTSQYHVSIMTVLRSWGALRTHLSRRCSQTIKPGHLLSFTCVVCNSCSFDNERHYFEHVGRHLKRFETVPCVFQGCGYKTNIYTTFHSHKSRKHNPHSIDDFKTSVLHQYQNEPDESTDSFEVENNCDSVAKDEEDLHNIIIQRLGLLLLKMECIFNVSKTCIDELVEELSFLTASASGSLIKNCTESFKKV